MSCNFCLSTPLSGPCPVCSAGATVATPLRKSKARAPKVPAGFQRVTAPPPAIRNVPPSPHTYQFSNDPEVARLRKMAANDARIAELNAALRAAVAPTMATPAVTPPPTPIAPQRPVTASTGPVKVTTWTPKAAPLTDWHAAAAFTRSVLRKPLALLPQTVDSTCREVDGDKTQVGPAALRRGDWAGLARAVEAGWMTEAQAIDLAQGWQTWRVGVAS